MIGWNDEFEWDKHNVGHIAKHQVSIYEAEEGARDIDAVVRRAGTDRFGNPEYLYICRTVGGRYLFQVIDRKAPSLWRVGASRPATDKEKQVYRRRNR